METKTYYFYAHISEGKHHLERAKSSEIQYYYDNAKCEYLYAIGHYKTAESLAKSMGNKKLENMASARVLDCANCYNSLLSKIREKE